MKKLIVFSAIVALLAPAVFAEVGVGGQGIGKVTLFEGNSEKDSKVYGGSGYDGHIRIEGENDEGTFGGMFRIGGGNLSVPDFDDPDADWGGNWFSNGGDFGTNAWWKPVDMLKIQLGRHYYNFGLPTIGAWGFHAMGNDVGVSDYTWLGFGGMDDWSFGSWGLSLALSPIEGLGINYYIPYDNETKEAGDHFGRSVFHFSYNISDVGTIVAKAQLGTMNYKIADDPKDQKNNLGFAKAAVAFELGAIENIGVTIGVIADLPQTVESLGGKTTTMHPVEVGVGFALDPNDGLVGFKARLKAALAGSTEFKPDTGDSIKTDVPLKFGLDIMPYFNFGAATLFVQAGFGITAAQKDADGKEIDDTSVFGWQFNPYIKIGTFYAGVKVWSFDNDKDPDDKARIHFAVPVGIHFDL